MDDSTLDLIDALTDNVIAQINQEIALGRVLRAASDDERSQIAYYMQDRFHGHQDRPAHASVAMSKVEQYIAYHLRKAHWHAAWDDMVDEAQELDEMDRSLFEDDVTLTEDYDLDEDFLPDGA